MEFRDLKQQYKVLKPQIDTAVEEAMSSCQFISGPQVRELEKKLAAFVGVKHCISCANGTDALSLALMAWGIGAGDAVFVPDFTFFATGEVVAARGAVPVFVDVCEDSYNMDVSALERAIQRVLEDGKLIPRVVIPVDLFGLPADFVKIREIANKYGLRVLEDGAQGFGGKIGEQVACSFGEIATTSFFPAKPLGCYGDGGAIFTNDDETAALLRSLCVHGKGSNKYDNVRIGVNSRLDSIQAAILSVKLKAFADYEVEQVNQAADWYTQRLKGVVPVPEISNGSFSSWAQYTIRLKDEAQRNAVQAALKEQGIPTMVYYPKPMHEQEAFAGMPYLDNPCPVTQRLSKTVLSLPMHPYLTQEDVDTVCAALEKCLEGIE